MTVSGQRTRMVAVGPKIACGGLVLHSFKWDDAGTACQRFQRASDTAAMEARQTNPDALGRLASGQQWRDCRVARVPSCPRCLRGFMPLLMAQPHFSKWVIKFIEAGTTWNAKALKTLHVSCHYCDYSPVATATYPPAPGVSHLFQMNLLGPQLRVTLWCFKRFLLCCCVP